LFLIITIQPLGEGCTPSVEKPPPVIKVADTVNPLAENPVAI
jgi:hypothetical protein